MEIAIMEIAIMEITMARCKIESKKEVVPDADTDEQRPEGVRCATRSGAILQRIDTAWTCSISIAWPTATQTQSSY